MTKKLPTPEPSPAESPLLPCPTSPMQQSESEGYRQSYQKPSLSYPYDRVDDIVSREIDNDNDD